MLQKLKNQAAKNVLNHYFVQCETGGFEPLLFVFWIWCAILLPQPVDRWEKETAAAQCVFSTLRWHELDFFEMIVAILLFLLGQAR